MLLSSLFFKPHIFTDPNSILAITPNSQYGAVRSTLEREQQVGRRAMAVNIARGVIPMLSTAGALVDFMAAADFAVATGMYGLSEKLFEIVYPDKTVRQLIALDTRTFRVGMLLKNNDQRPILFFIHRELVMCSLKGSKCLAPKKSTTNPITLDRLPYVKEFHPSLLKSKLGSLGLIGETVAFSNRLVVISKDESTIGVQPPATIYEIDSSKEIEQGDSATITISGINLASINVAAVGGALEKGITVSAPKLTSDKAVATIDVLIAEDTKPGFTRSPLALLAWPKRFY